MSDRSPTRFVIIGTSFAGYTAALEARRRLPDDVEIVVLAPSPVFVFVPSLIWVPFGIRDEEDITFDVRPQYEKHGVDFRQGLAESFDPEANVVRTTVGDLAYDYLLIATGPRPDWQVAPGMGPGQHSWSILNLPDALQTRAGFEAYLEDPGPVVIGATQHAACFGAAYEFVLNLRYRLHKNKVDPARAPLTFVTAEPFLSHFGIGGFGAGRSLCEKLFEHYDIGWRTDAVVEEVTAEGVRLAGGEELASAFTMLMPPFTGVEAVRRSSLSNDAGFVETNDGYQHPLYPNIYAAGVAVHVPPPGETPVACGVPKTGYPSEQMAKIAVANIAHDLAGDEGFEKKPFGEMKALCVMDAGNMGMMILGDHMLEPRDHETIIPGPQAHWAKIAWEKHYLGSRRRGII